MKRRRFTLLTNYLLCRLCNYDVPITSQVSIPTSLTIISHRGRKVLRFHNDRSLIVKRDKG